MNFFVCWSITTEEFKHLDRLMIFNQFSLLTRNKSWLNSSSAFSCLHFFLAHSVKAKGAFDSHPVQPQLFRRLVQLFYSQQLVGTTSIMTSPLLHDYWKSQKLPLSGQFRSWHSIRCSLSLWAKAHIHISLATAAGEFISVTFPVKNWIKTIFASFMNFRCVLLLYLVHESTTPMNFWNNKCFD